MTPRWRRVVVIVAVFLVAATGCSKLIDGSISPDGSGVSISDDAANWAISAVDPCVLLDSIRLDPAPLGRPYLTAPHSCAIDARLASGAQDQLVVRIGEPFDTKDRAQAVPIRLAGVGAYQGYVPQEDRAAPPPRCKVHIPISATRAIEVQAAASVPDLPAGCATARQAAEAVAAKLAAPQELTGQAPPTALRRWQVCDLLQKALDAPPRLDQRRYDDADTCSAESQTPGSTNRTTTEVETKAGWDPAQDPDGPRLRRTSLTFGQAEVLAVPDGCWVTFAAEAIPGAPPERGVQRMQLRIKGGPSDCGSTVDGAERIHRTLQSPPPPASTPPSRLGFPEGQPDDEMPVACGVISDSTASDCRPPRPVEVPRGDAPAVVGLAGNSDVLCAMLTDAVTDVLGREVEYAAWQGGSCFAVTPDGFVVKLDLNEEYRVDEYCTGFELRREAATVGGRKGWECEPNTSRRNLYLPAFGDDGREPGYLHVEGELRPPRGVDTTSKPEDRGKVTDLTDRIATYVIKTYLA